MTEIIASGWSWQSHYSSGSGGKWTRGFSEHRESCPSVQKKIDWLAPTVINTWGSSGVIIMGACVGTPGHLQFWLSWEPDLWGLNLRGQSLLQYGPLPTGHGAGGGLDAWWQSHLRCPSLFTWVPLGTFPQAVSEQVWQPLLGLQSIAWFFFACYFPPSSFPPIFSTIIYCLSQLQQFF